MNDANQGDRQQPLRITVGLDLDYDELYAVVRLVTARLREQVDERRTTEDPVSDAYLTVDEAAELARCSPETIRRAIKSARLPAFRTGRRLLMNEADVRGWIESCPAAASRSSPRWPRHRSRKPAAGSVEALREIERRLTE